MGAVALGDDSIYASLCKKAPMMKHHNGNQQGTSLEHADNMTTAKAMACIFTRRPDQGVLLDRGTRHLPLHKRTHSNTSAVSTTL
jgi:hypothetical protein